MFKRETPTGQADGTGIEFIFLIFLFPVPMPFNPITTIRYKVKFKSEIKIRVYNTLGKMAAELVNKIQEPGKYEITFNGKVYQAEFIFIIRKSTVVFLIQKN